MEALLSERGCLKKRNIKNQVWMFSFSLISVPLEHSPLLLASSWSSQLWLYTLFQTQGSLLL